MVRLRSTQPLFTRKARKHRLLMSHRERIDIAGYVASQARTYWGHEVRAHAHTTRLTCSRPICIHVLARMPLPRCRNYRESESSCFPREPHSAVLNLFTKGRGLLALLWLLLLFTLLLLFLLLLLLLLVMLLRQRAGSGSYGSRVVPPSAAGLFVRAV